MRRGILGKLPAIAAAAVLGIAVPASALAQTPEISARRAAERTSFTDAEIAFGFFRIAFGAELQFGGSADQRIRRYDRPVRVFVENRARRDRSAVIAEVVADIGRRVARLDIAMTERREDANVVVRLVRDRDLSATIRELYGPRGRKIMQSLEPQCLSGFRRDGKYRIISSDVILVVDAGEFLLYDCAYEEILQALGPIQDDPEVPWTMFNDDNKLGFFGVYDQYLLNILYHPRIRPGMTRREVRALLPKIMPEVRAFVAEVNGLKSRVAPRKERGGKLPSAGPPSARPPLPPARPQQQQR